MRQQSQQTEARKQWIGWLVALIVALSNSKALGAYQLTIPYFLSASDPMGRQGFVRIINHSDVSDKIGITAIDDSGARFGPISLTVGPWQTLHFNSDDLEMGNAQKGIFEGLGPGEGDWRLEISVDNDGQRVEALAFVRHRDGFLTSIYDSVSGQASYYRVHTFNPGSNNNQVSRLRMIGLGKNDAEITIVGVDDEGIRSPRVSLTLLPGQTREFTARELESGHDFLNGSLGDGAGKWQLFINASQSIEVMSLMESRTAQGHLTNLSTLASDEEYDLPSMKE